MRIFLLAIALLADAAPEKWEGIWILDIGRSTFGTILFPGVPRNLKVISQELRIETADSEVRLSGETGVEVDGKTLRQKDTTRLSLDGAESRIGPAVFTLRTIDAYTF